MSFTIPFPSVANNGTGETEAVVSHPFLPVPMDKIKSCVESNVSCSNDEPMVGELMFTNPTLTRRISARERGSHQGCVVVTQRLMNLLLQDNSKSDLEQWRFIGSFLNKMGGMYNIIVSRKASLLCPFAFLETERQYNEVATLDTVVLVYDRNNEGRQSIDVRIISSADDVKIDLEHKNKIVPIGTVMFPPVRACASKLVSLITNTSEDAKIKDLMTKLPVLVVELGTYI